MNRRRRRVDQGNEEKSLSFRDREYARWAFDSPCHCTVGSRGYSHFVVELDRTGQSTCYDHCISLGQKPCFIKKTKPPYITIWYSLLFRFFFLELSTINYFLAKKTAVWFFAKSFTTYINKLNRSLVLFYGKKEKHSLVVCKTTMCHVLLVWCSSDTHTVGTKVVTKEISNLLQCYTTLDLK